MKVKCLLVLILQSFALALFAQDKATLDLLVSKNIITEAEAKNIAFEELKQSAEIKNKDTQKFSIYGAIQAQYHFINSAAESPVKKDSASANGFQIRRLYLGMYGDLGAGFSGVIDLDLVAGGNVNAPYLNGAFVSKKFDEDTLNGTAYLGYLKVHFGVEEKTNALYIYSVDRSMATRYFTMPQGAGSGNVGFGSAYTGLFWDGLVKEIKGLGYGFAFTNAQNYSTKPSTSPEYDNTFNFWGNIIYKNDFELLGNKLNYKFALNFGYGSGANSKIAGSGNPNKNGQIIGFNPYLELKYENLTLWGEGFVTEIEYGRANGTQNATPFGINFCAEYLFNIGSWGKAGPLFRYTYLNTDGRGARIADCISSAPNVDSSLSNNNLYDTAQSFYLGANWYIYGQSLKIQAGYEWAQFSGSAASAVQESKLANVNSFRIQVQIIF